MIILVDCILSVLLIAFGYVSVCCYFNNIKPNAIEITILRPNKKRILYLTAGVIISIVLIVLFQLIYKQTMLSQMKLLSLVLVILPIACVDYKVQKIPNLFLIFGLTIWAIYIIAELIISHQTVVNTLKNSILGAAIIGIFFLLLLLIFKNSIGMGDVKLFALMGLYQGLWGAINSVFFSLVVSFVISVFLLVTKKKGRKDTISFGPSILLGTVIAISLSGM